MAMTRGELILRSAAECCFWTHGRVFAQVSMSRVGLEGERSWTHDQLGCCCVAR